MIRVLSYDSSDDKQQPLKETERRLTRRWSNEVSNSFDLPQYPVATASNHVGSTMLDQNGGIERIAIVI